MIYWYGTCWVCVESCWVCAVCTHSLQPRIVYSRSTFQCPASWTNLGEPMTLDDPRWPSMTLHDPFGQAIRPSRQRFEVDIGWWIESPELFKSKPSLTLNIHQRKYPQSQARDARWLTAVSNWIPKLWRIGTFVEACLTEFQVNPETSKLKISQIRFERVTTFCMIFISFWCWWNFMNTRNSVWTFSMHSATPGSGPGDTAGCTSTAFRWIESRSLVQALRWIEYDEYMMNIWWILYMFLYVEWTRMFWFLDSRENPAEVLNRC